ncbi:hypothetical protein [Pseudoalteromonas denitrificans]|uniref:Lipoprotein n=1 Tax=Pseudoalteromonas denitrificans DSM 6059 TaxID=1123010 RepID=A0A1I1GXH3_9GAMM|nr:hypothetical protein [Pseudoalteromonas denitrificans]SFC16549.1 hypothetical protein SAMN02745724_01073 [Pseudoalteromonas denitrificans DSM 6059]
MSKISSLFLLSLIMFLISCTQGHIVYTTPDGKQKKACETEYTWAPSIDKYAVEYILSYCTKRAIAKGYMVQDKSLVDKKLTIVPPPFNKKWTHKLAKDMHKAGKINNKEYGYLIAYLDLGHNKAHK